MIIRWKCLRSYFSDRLYICIFRMNNILMKSDIRQQPEHHARCLLIYPTVIIFRREIYELLLNNSLFLFLKNRTSCR